MKKILPSFPQAKYVLHWILTVSTHNMPPFWTLPWMNYQAINWLSKNLDKTYRVFEFGSGFSTMYIAPRVEEIISVEHDQEWYTHLSEKLKGDDKYKSVKHVLREPVKTSKPGIYSSTDPHYRGYSFKKYCQEIDKYPDKYFDLVIIDGRARVQCATHALPKVKSGGYIILDNTERGEYEAASKLVNGKSSKVIKFQGYSPMNNYREQSTLFKIR